MLFASWLDIQLTSGQTWVIPVAGLGVALLTLLVGRLVQSRWRGRAADGTRADDDAVHDPFEHGSIAEQRQGARRKGNPIEVLISDAEVEQEPWRGWVTDRSVNGLCLLLHEEMAAGTVLSVKPRQAPPGMPWVRLEVQYCKRDSSGYQVGCQFASTPPWGVLLLFG